MAKFRIVFKRPDGPERNWEKPLEFVAVTDDAGTPLDTGEIGLPDGMEWMADGQHEALEIDTDKLK